MCLFFLVYCFQPWAKFGYRRTRRAIINVIGEIVIAPFGKVRFRHFFFADILTSIVSNLQDIGFALVFLLDSGLKMKIDKNGVSMLTYLFLASFLPFWWRFLQCIHKYRETELKVHLVNAGKYMSKIIPPVAVLALGKSTTTISGQHFWVYCSANVFATLFCLFWDFYMDWGMFRTTAPGKFCLRDKITFKPWFYYYAMVSNFLFRFVWVVAVFKFQDN